MNDKNSFVGFFISNIDNNKVDPYRSKLVISIYFLESETNDKSDTVVHDVTYNREELDDTIAVKIVDKTVYENEIKNKTKKRFFIWK